MQTLIDYFSLEHKLNIFESDSSVSAYHAIHIMTLPRWQDTSGQNSLKSDVSAVCIFYDINMQKSLFSGLMANVANMRTLTNKQEVTVKAKLSAS